MFLSKQLVRLPEWVACQGGGARQGGKKKGGKGGGGCGGGLGGGGCHGGILVSKANEGRIEACPVCRTTNIKAERAEEEPDEEVQKMIKDGKIRHCPKCRLPTMKEYGICNVINCEQCGVWWNWRTNDTGRSSREVKEKARQRGTLWEPGELQYQQTLQQSDPSAFKNLLERNGMHYDPNYRRGTG